MARTVPAEFPARDGRRGEQEVFEALAAQLPHDALLLHSLWLDDGRARTELDLVVLWPGVGLAVVEVKGGVVERDAAGAWWSVRHERRNRLPVPPMTQAGDGRGALVRHLAAHGLAHGARAACLVALPHVEVPSGYDSGDLPRRLVLDRRDLPRAAERVRAAIESGSGQRPLDAADVDRALDLLLPVLEGHDLVAAELAEHEHEGDVRTRDGAMALELLSLQPRFTVIGPAGTGKTWLALEQARRKVQDGRRVALLCYSRGLGRFLQDQVASWPRRPAFTGLFHDLATAWGGPPPPDGGAEALGRYYEHELPTALGALAPGHPDRFDDVVVDEAQDFGPEWWTSLLACLRDPDHGGVFVFQDEEQRLFEREATPPVAGHPYPMTRVVRSTKRIAQLAGSLRDGHVRATGLAGPPVVVVECQTVEEVLARADDAVEALLDDYPAGAVALLTTSRRHPEHVAQVTHLGDAGYWAGVFAEDDVAYGTVPGFKGLERSAVVLAVNGFSAQARARQMLYVGMTRARSRLVLVAVPSTLAEVGGEAMARRLQGAQRWDL